MEKGSTVHLVIRPQMTEPDEILPPLYRQLAPDTPGPAPCLAFVVPSLQPLYSIISKLLSFLLPSLSSLFQLLCCLPAEITVGRAPGSSWTAHHPLLSGTHCKIGLLKRSLYITDLSRNGVWMKNQRLQKGRKYRL